MIRYDAHRLNAMLLWIKYTIPTTQKYTVAALKLSSTTCQGASVKIVRRLYLTGTSGNVCGRYWCNALMLWTANTSPANTQKVDERNSGLSARPGSGSSTSDR